MAKIPYKVKPHHNEIGKHDLIKSDVRRLHNLLYYEDRDRAGCAAGEPC